MQIKNSVWLLGVVALVGTLAYVKWEIVRNRREIDRPVSEAPAKIEASATPKDVRLLITNPPPQASQTNPQQNQALEPLEGLLDLAVKTGQRATELLVSNPPPASKPSDANQPQDAVGALLNLATKTAQRVDQMGLKASELSDEEEMKLGDQLDREVLRGMPQASDPKALARLEALAKPLIDQCQRKLIQYKIRILKSSKISAFGSAGGHLYFTTAFLKRFSADEELAMTLGHELAHIELKHAVHKVQYLYHGQKTFGDFATAGQIVYTTLSSPYTKEQEFEADALGFDACRKAGWEASKLLSLYEEFIKLEQEQARDQTTGSPEPTSELERRVEDYFSSHPPTAERLARLKARASS
jgi:hypothetical protein